VAVYTRASHVDAPLADVWEFHSRAEGLAALTPGFANLRIEATRGPDGTPDPDVLDAGAEVEVSVRPFGVGPRQRWVSRIVDRGRADGRAYFVDRMVEGPLARWEHTHRFVAEGSGTRLVDRVDWAPPGGAAGELAARLGVVGLAPAFAYRHRRTRTLLEE